MELDQDDDMCLCGHIRGIHEDGCFRCYGSVYTFNGEEFADCDCSVFMHEKGTST